MLYYYLGAEMKKKPRTINQLALSTAHSLEQEHVAILHFGELHDREGVLVYKQAVARCTASAFDMRGDLLLVTDLGNVLAVDDTPEAAAARATERARRQATLAEHSRRQD